MKTKSLSFKSLCLFLVLAFILTCAPVSFTQAQVTTAAYQPIYGLPGPKEMIKPSADYSFPVLKGIQLDPNDPLQITFIVDTGSQSDISEAEAYKLINYFLAGLTLPEKDLWVNLSPYEKDRIVPSELSQTDLGRDMLGQDYILKQIASSLTYPESDTGKAYWNTLYQQTASLARKAGAPLDAYNKVWIVPQSAMVYEHENKAMIASADLKAMLEKDMVAMEHNQTTENEVASKIMKEMILPQINSEINHGKNFAQLRQIYYSLVLASWFKKKFKNSFYKNYINQKQTGPIELSEKNSKEKIYNLYCKAFKDGLYNYIKKETGSSGKTAYRHYFSGGLNMETDLNPKVASKAVTKTEEDGVGFTGRQKTIRAEGFNAERGPRFYGMSSKYSGNENSQTAEWLANQPVGLKKGATAALTALGVAVGSFGATAPVQTNPVILDQHTPAKIVVDQKSGQRTFADYTKPAGLGKILDFDPGTASLDQLIDTFKTSVNDSDPAVKNTVISELAKRANNGDTTIVPRLTALYQTYLDSADAGFSSMMYGSISPSTVPAAILFILDKITTFKDWKLINNWYNAYILAAYNNHLVVLSGFCDSHVYNREFFDAYLMSAIMARIGTDIQNWPISDVLEGLTNSYSYSLKTVCAKELYRRNYSGVSALVKANLFDPMFRDGERAGISGWTFWSWYGASINNGVAGNSIIPDFMALDYNMVLFSMLGALNDTTNDANLRGHMCLALCAYGKFNDVFNELVAAADSAVPDGPWTSFSCIGYDAVEGLPTLFSRQDRSFIKHYINSDTSYVRFTALTAFVGSSYNGIDSTVYKGLIWMISDTTIRKQQWFPPDAGYFWTLLAIDNAVNALGYVGDSGAIPYLNQLLSDVNAGKFRELNSNIALLEEFQRDIPQAIANINKKIGVISSPKTPALKHAVSFTKMINAGHMESIRAENFNANTHWTAKVFDLKGRLIDEFSGKGQTIHWRGKPWIQQLIIKVTPKNDQSFNNSPIGEDKKLAEKNVGGIKLDDIPVEVSANTLPSQVNGVDEDFFSKFRLKIVEIR